MHKVGILRSN